MKDNSPDSIDGLLIKVILREASEEEVRQVDEWMSSSAANRLYFEDFQKIWEDSRNLAIHSAVNEDEAWTRFRQRVATPVIPVPRRIGLPWLRIAAVFFVLAAAAWLFYTYSSNKPVQRFSLRTGNDTRIDTLSDGTIVTLNRNSILTTQKDLGGNARAVELEGEAFFLVAPDKSRPFTVHTKHATIDVLGTSFNVRAALGSTEVIVETGLVQVRKDQRSVNLRPHEKALVSENNADPRKEDNPDDLYNYYRTHEFVCNSTSLGRLVEILNEAYGAHIVVANSSLNRMALTTTFSNESLDEILSIVCKTLKLTSTKKDGQIVLKPV